MKTDLAGVKSILVIKLRGVGDVLLSTIVTPNLRNAFPHAKIDYLTEPASVPVFTGNQFIDDVVVFDRKSMSGLDLIRLVRSKRYSMVIDLFGNPRTALVTRLSGAGIRVGYRFRGRSYAYNRIVEPRGGIVHNTQFNLDALESLGIAIIDRNLYFPVNSDDEMFINRFLEKEEIGDRNLVAINTSGGWSTKRWGLDRFAELADRIQSRHKVPIVIVWGPGEREEAEALSSRMTHRATLAPATTLKQLGALFQRCAFLVSNDSGPLHIAAAMGTPVVGIYGPTNPKLQGPYGAGHVVVRNETVPCLGCNLTACPINHPCMKELSVDMVESAVERLLSINRMSL